MSDLSNAKKLMKARESVNRLIEKEAKKSKKNGDKDNSNRG
jgi:hypothetical protein